MESNRDEASRCIELSRLYIKKKDLDKAWKFSVKAHKLFPTSKTKCLMNKLKSSLKRSKRRTAKHHHTMSGDSDTSYNGDKSNSSTSNCATPTEELAKRTKNKKSSESSTAYSFNMFKDINKDESHKCLEIADQHIQNKQYELAEKFVLKSKKLFLLPRADELLKNIQELKEINKPTYTEEQANFVKKVKNSENFYSMLDIKSTANVSEIKKAYKKIALLLHPDKNTAPGSGEVFTVVSNAVGTLCDDTKRRAYDQTLWKPKPHTSNYSTFPSHSYYRQQSSRTSFGTHRNPFRFYQNSYDESSDGDDVYGDGDDDDEDNDYCSESEYVNTFDFFESYEY